MLKLPSRYAYTVHPVMPTPGGAQCAPRHPQNAYLGTPGTYVLHLP